MDATPALRGPLHGALRRFLGRVVLGAAALGASACASTPREGKEAANPHGVGASPRGVTGRPDPITTGSPSSVHSQIAAALSSSGHDCKAQSDRVACKGDVEKGPAFFVGYREYPARLLFGSPWLLKDGCPGALVAINEFNWSFDELHATCNEDGAMVVTTVYFIPEGGVTTRDLTQFVRWWTLSEVRALSGSRLGAMLR